MCDGLSSNMVCVSDVLHKAMEGATASLGTDVYGYGYESFPGLPCVSLFVECFLIDGEADCIGRKEDPEQPCEE